VEQADGGAESAGCGGLAPPAELVSNDPAVLRSALAREAGERRRAECRANIQTEVVQLALDLLVQEPDVEGFFGALTRTVVHESESHTCGVWLIDEAGEQCGLWMAHVGDRLYTPQTLRGDGATDDAYRAFPSQSMAAHLFAYKPGWTRTVEYEREDPRLPEQVRDFSRRQGCHVVATPLLLGGRNFGWMTVGTPNAPEAENQWWRVVLIEAVARQAALALHHSRLIERNLREEHRKAILEERNRLARDIHDNLAQGFAAILMQLQGAQRASAHITSPAVASSIDIAVELARTHLAEARRSVGALRPNVGNGEDLATAIRRLADMSQRTAGMPVDVVVGELPRLGDGVEREILAITQEALTNAIRHSSARRVTIRASTAPSVGLRLSVADDGRGIAGDRRHSGFGMTSMQERADRIGASLTVVTAPRNGTEIVLAWEPSSLPTQVHVAAV
jgi:signal transduction histidine kinase